MQAELERLPASAPLDAIHAALTQPGAVLVEDFLPGEMLASIRADVEAPLAAADPGMKHMNPGRAGLSPPAPGAAAPRPNARKRTGFR